MRSDKPYFWNIENDSYFYNAENFLEKSLEILETNRDVSIIHLKRWTFLDGKDSPGVETNMTRVSEIRTSKSGFQFYLMEQREEYALWTPLRDELITDLKLDEEAGVGKCSLGTDKIGSVRITKSGRYERLLTEHWNSYTNHGWVGKTEDLKYLIKKYDPVGERQMSVAFKKQFRAAKLDEDAFIDFGWNKKILPTEQEIIKTFLETKNSKKSSIDLFGNLNPKFIAGNIIVEENKIDVYS